MDSKALIRMLVEGGWKEVRVVGSHHTFKHPDRAMILTVPHPKKDLPIGTVNSILKKAGLK
ncbi:type II toxin-antitoxin system HicA family toxin [Massilia sp. UMI-21]|nr:type II toxin-antitoxin system HicA family toxin [Massilia sp. UMI-21]